MPRELSNVHKYKFRAGQRVKWWPEYMGEYTIKEISSRYREGPFVVDKVQKLPAKSFKSVGHTQWITLKGYEWDSEYSTPNWISGAYFQPVK